MKPAVFSESRTAANVVFAGRLPKRGAELAECEDRVSWGADGDQFRAAVADGASASLLAGEWADLLAAAYCSQGSLERGALVETITEQAKTWKKLADQHDLPWYALAKLASGAFAALVGVCVQKDGIWTASAVGDSCVVQVRREPRGHSPNSGCIFAFPLSRTGQFGSTPSLIGTEGALEPGKLAVCEGQWVDADDLYLMTDALAEWFLGEVQQSREPWRWFDALEVPSNPISFEKLISDLRSSGKLKDDDVTLLHVKLSGGKLES